MSAESTIDAARFARTLTLIVFVTAVFLFVLAERLEDELFQIGAIAVGAVAVLTAIVGFLIAASTYTDQPDRVE